PVADFFITSCLRARRSATASPLANVGKTGVAPPPLVERKSGPPGHRPPANRRGLAPSQPACLAARKIQWAPAGCIYTPVATTRSTVSQAPTSPDILAELSHRAASV